MIDNLSINTINTYNISPFPQEIVELLHLIILHYGK